MNIYFTYLISASNYIVFNILKIFEYANKSLYCNSGNNNKASSSNVFNTTTFCIQNLLSLVAINYITNISNVNTRNYVCNCRTFLIFLDNGLTLQTLDNILFLDYIGNNGNFLKFLAYLVE